MGLGFGVGGDDFFDGEAAAAEFGVGGAAEELEGAVGVAGADVGGLDGANGVEIGEVDPADETALVGGGDGFEGGWIDDDDAGPGGCAEACRWCRVVWVGGVVVEGVGVGLAGEFGHGIFADAEGGVDAEAVGEELVEFVAADFAGAAFEAAGFHDAGAWGELPGLGDVVEELDETKGGAEDGGGGVFGLCFVEGFFERVEIGLDLVGFGVFGEKIIGVGVGPAVHEFAEHE